MKKTAAVLLAIIVLTSSFAFQLRLNLIKKAGSGVYQLNVIHSEVPSLDDATFTVWLSARAFAVGSGKMKRVCVTDSGNGNRKAVR